MSPIRPLALALCVAAAGCGQDRAGPETSSNRPKAQILVEHADDPGKLPPGMKLAPARNLDAPDRVDRTPHVSDDPAQIAEVRRLHEQEEKELYDGAFGQLRELGILVSRYRNALERRKDLALAELKRIMKEDRAATDELRARAARTLIELGDRSGETFLLDAVRNGQGPRRAAALQMLDDWRLKEKVDLGRPDHAGLILACLDDRTPEVVRAAARLCADRKLPGAEAKLVGLLEGGKAEDPRQLARELANVAERPESVRLVIDYLLRDRPAEHAQWTGYVLERLIKDPDPKIAEPVRAAFLRYMLGFTGKLRYDQSVVRDLARVADRTTIPVLEDILANAKDPISRVYALDALATLDPGHAVDRVLDFIRAGNRFDLTTSVLEKSASEKDADRIINAFLETQKASQRSITLGEARLLINHLGPRGRKVVAESLDTLQPSARMWATWKLKGLSLDAAIDDLKAAGTIAMRREAVLEAMRRDRESAGETEPIDPSDRRALYGVLSQAGVLTMFDVETDELPCNHHQLIMEFAENSAGGFDPECAVQAWHRKNKDDLEAPYTVRFIDKGRLYRFDAENRGDWYDVAAVQHALNFALKTAGRKERFIGLETGGQEAAFVFADPGAFRPIAMKYGLLLSNDPDSAMRQGKEFEQKVIEQIKSKQEP